MKEKKDILQSTSPRNTDDALHVISFNNPNVFDESLDDAIKRISEMSIEEIKSELAQIEALDIPIPKFSDISRKRQTSSIYNYAFRVSKYLTEWYAVDLNWLKNKSLSPFTSGLVAVSIIVFGIFVISRLVVSPEITLRNISSEDISKIEISVEDENLINNLETIPFEEFAETDKNQIQNQEIEKIQIVNRNTNKEKNKLVIVNRQKQVVEIIKNSKSLESASHITENEQQKNARILLTGKFPVPYKGANTRMEPVLNVEKNPNTD